MDNRDPVRAALKKLVEQFDAYRGGWLGPHKWVDRIGLPDDLAAARAAISTPAPASSLGNETERADEAVQRPLPSPSVVHIGCAGHNIIARWCAFRRHTQIGTQYRVSTVGDYYSERGNKRETIGDGPDAFFETYVFETTDHPADGSEGCGCLAVKNWGEIDGVRYATAGEAQAGHEAMVQKYVVAVQERQCQPQKTSIDARSDEQETRQETPPIKETR